MRNPKDVWTDPENAEYPLAELREGYLTYVQTRSKPVSRETVTRYKNDLRSFEASLALHGEPLTLNSLNPFNVERWILDMREGRIGRTAGGRKTLARGFAEESISARVSSIKTFSYKYVYRRLELTKWDVLVKVERFDPPVRTKPGLSEDELERVLTCYDDSDEYAAIRDAAIMLVFASSALRFSAVMRLKVDEVDRWSGRITAIDKGNKERRVKVGERACKALRRYWRIRRAADGVQELFTTHEGRAFTYQGGQSVFRCLKKVTGLEWMHSHRFRHTWAQGAIRKGAELALVQEAMGWNSDRMAKRYQGWVRQERAAEAMPALAPV